MSASTESGGRWVTSYHAESYGRPQSAPFATREEAERAARHLPGGSVRPVVSLEFS